MSANQLAFDGEFVWTANYLNNSVSRLPVLGGIAGAGIVTFSGFLRPIDVVYDGTHIWVSEFDGNRIRKLATDGSTLLTVAVGSNPMHMAYDGANLWVPNFSDNSLTVVQASTGAVVATIASSAANRLGEPALATFDGERILVTNQLNDSVTLFRAADLSLIGNVSLGAGSGVFGACSDGINLWVVLNGPKLLLRI